MRLALSLFTLTFVSSAGFAQSPAGQKPVNFARDVIVILTKDGCNSSSCHGGVTGKGGFKLSLDGLDPREDYKWIAKGGTYQVLSPEELPPVRSRVDLPRVVSKYAGETEKKLACVLCKLACPPITPALPRVPGWW